MEYDHTNFTSVQPQFVVTDLEASAMYYKEKLGFSVLGYGYHDHEKISVGLERGRVVIHLQRSDTSSGCPNSKFARPVVEFGRSKEIFDIAITINDVQAYVKELKERGATITDVFFREGGISYVTVADPDGYLIDFFG